MVMKNIYAAIIGFVVLMSAIPRASRGYPVFLWPIDRPAMITGTFGEYRGPHFHHGIDVSTAGRTGYAVFAADDGYVSSVLYQQWGIGYAVIITHGNGWSTMYGHLERFDDAIMGNADEGPLIAVKQEGFQDRSRQVRDTGERRENHSLSPATAVSAWSIFTSRCARPTASR